jgi:protein-S-isoprenylcysteine O-methyltransferase Ste14
MNAETAANILWPVWYVTWMAAVVFSAKTKTQMRTDMSGMHRMLAGFGSILLFFPAFRGRPAHAATFLEWWTQKLWRAPAWTEWSLFALIVLAFAFCWWARLHLGRLWSGLVTLKEDHRVIDTGPYGLVRHPIYSGVIFAAAMTALLRASPASFLGLILFATGFSMTAAIEERFLREQLGEGAYDAYSRRVGMLVPMVR